jgi:5-methylcytosine-specific restriction protein A
MPTSALRPCSYPGCANLVRSGRCELHPMQVVDQHNPENQKLYNTARWKRLRRLQLSQHPWCEECLRANIYTPATDVDHIEPHRGDPARFYQGKLQSLCVPCHSRKTAAEVFGKKR